MDEEWQIRSEDEHVNVFPHFTSSYKVFLTKQGIGVLPLSLFFLKGVAFLAWGVRVNAWPGRAGPTSLKKVC